MPTDPRDAILQQQCPVVMVPKFGAFEPLAENGHRFLAAADGLHLEITRPWLHLVTRIAHSEMPLPYGVIEDSVDYKFDVALLNQFQTVFLRDACAALPNECAAWIVFDDRSRELYYKPLPPLEASPGGITYNRPALSPHRWLLLDLHSHGFAPPFFSATDDKDDAGEVKLAAVVGNLDKTPEWALRLCALGVRVDGREDA